MDQDLKSRVDAFYREVQTKIMEPLRQQHSNLSRSLSGEYQNDGQSKKTRPANQ